MSGRWEVVLPWSTPPLSLNDRHHHWAKARIVAGIRADAGWVIRDAGIPACARVRIRLHYRPRTAGRRDSDNLIATEKPVVDALVDCGVVTDDHDGLVVRDRPVIHPRVRGEPGVMWLEVEALPALPAAVAVPAPHRRPSRRLSQRPRGSWGAEKSQLNTGYDAPAELSEWGRRVAETQARRRRPS